MTVNQVSDKSYEISDEILSLLLKDQTTKKNIIFATDNYMKRGHGLRDEILFEYCFYRKTPLFKARVNKSKVEQSRRIKEKAEVFTPSWVCNEQNNLIDNAWFNKEGVFNTEGDKKWVATKEKIDFASLNKSWEDYVNDIRLEITCGEAPYLTSRYDTVSGELIPLEERIGLLDRKLRVVSENTSTKEDWLKWAIKAYKAIYGYEFQGDNLFIARQNLLLTFVDYYYDKFQEIPDDNLLKEVVEIITWNVFQMDGLKFVVPFSCQKKPRILYVQLSLLENISDDDELEECPGCENNDIYAHTGTYCLVMDWDKDKKIKFRDLLKG